MLTAQIIEDGKSQTYSMGDISLERLFPAFDPFQKHHPSKIMERYRQVYYDEALVIPLKSGLVRREGGETIYLWAVLSGDKVEQYKKANPGYDLEDIAISLFGDEFSSHHAGSWFGTLPFIRKAGHNKYLVTQMRALDI